MNTYILVIPSPAHVWFPNNNIMDFSSIKNIDTCGGYKYEPELWDLTKLTFFHTKI